LTKDDVNKEMYNIMGIYTAALISEEKNLYAAIGVGNMLAEFGKKEEAAEIYRIVKEKDPDIPSAWLN